MRENRLRNTVLSVVVPVGAALIATTTASAFSALQTATYMNTFNAQTTNPTDQGSNLVYLGEDNNPPLPEDFYYDYGSALPNSTEALAWSSNTDDGLGTGSVMLSWQFNGPAEGADDAAFTTDIFPNNATGAQMVTAISFNLEVALGSATDAHGGNGYVQLFDRSGDSFDPSIMDDFTVTNAAGTVVDSDSDSGWEFGNPTYGAPDPEGTWDNINVTFPNAVPLRGITLQDYDSAGIDGTETFYFDPLTVTYLVPEPASLGLLGIGVPALLTRRRSKAKSRD
jgi:hypothetical protein